MEFEQKVSTLLSNSTENAKNLFVEEGLKVSSECKSEEGAKKYSTSGDIFVDNFAAISRFKEPRSYKEVAEDMKLLWHEDPLMCIKLAVYVRLITRKSVVVTKKKTETLEVQRGTGLKNEGIMRFLWLAINHSKTFKANINYFIAAGSWKDIFQMLSLDLQYHGWDNRKLDWNFMFSVIVAGLLNPDTTQLVRKYLPTIRTNKNCTTLESQADTIIGRWLAKRINSNSDKVVCYRQYRILKSTGTAHEWQRFISQELYHKINFDKVAGRALALLVGSKFLKNHNLEDKYSEWIESKPVAKFTGFVHELFAPFDSSWDRLESYREKTINAQFNQLIQTGKENVNTNSSLLVVRDTSGSMNAKAIGCNVSANCIAKSMALYFSYFLTGYFADTFAEFSGGCKLHKWIGETPVDKWLNDYSGSYADTNFQSVIDLFIKLKNQGVPERDFPSGLLVCSDGEFSNNGTNTETNFQTAITRLRKAGFSKEYVDNFKIILWDIPNNYYEDKPEVKFEDFANSPGFFYLSGYDPSIVSFILDGTEIKAPKNARELFEIAMNQTLLNKLKV